ncbi:MAG: amino acid racemase [Marmoricola sp.]
MIGVLGGMGPAATADFYAKLVRLTPAASDQDHPKVVIWGDPTIPDRTLALQGQGPDPSLWLLRGASVLREAGATMLAIPCNTAHAFLPAISAQLGLPVVHMIEETGAYLHTRMPHIHSVGVLATTGTVQSSLYQDWLAGLGVNVIVPDPETQDSLVMPAIRELKAGRSGVEVTAALAAAAHLVDAGAQVVIAGCTEVPLGLAQDQTPATLIDPTTVLAVALLRRAGHEPIDPTP